MGRILGEVAARVRGRPWGRDATRLAILEAARRIAACEGASAVSLSRTADEAGFARPTVYGHFRNKEELLASIVADDLTALGKLMHRSSGESAAEAHSEETHEPEETVNGHYAPLEIPAEETQAAVSEPEQPASEQSLETHESGPEEIPETAPEETIAPEPESSEPLWQETHEPEAGPEEIAIAPEPAQPEDNPRLDARSSFTQPRVDAWLERRLRVFEHTLGELSARMDKAEHSAERAEGLVAEGMRDIQQHLDAAEVRAKDNADSILRRVEAADQRNLAAIATLRAEMLRAVDPDAPKAEALVHEDKLTFIPAPVPEEPRPKPEPSDSFLDAARRAANAAAEMAEAESKISGPLMGGIAWPANDDKRKLYTRYLISCVGVLALVLVGAGLVLRHGAADVKEMSPLPKMASAHAETMPSSKTNAAAPLDRLTALANSGDAQAALIVGLKYMQTPGSDASAAQWLARSANAHEPVAQYMLGTMYERGIGVGKDAGQAVHWYQTAAAEGNRKAMYRLGVAYAVGSGVTQDYAQAATWFLKAANEGLVDAQFNLAVLYERGQGVPQSLLDAYKWYAIAASQGDKESADRVEALSAQITPDDLQAAENAVRDFAPAGFDRQANLAPTIADVAGP